MNRPTFQKLPVSRAVSALCLAMAASAATAQTTTAPDAPAAAASAAKAQPAAASAGKDGASAQLDTVVITGTRRAERLQDVPLAVSVVKGKELEDAGIKDLNSIIQAVPGLDFTEGSRAPGFKVRGIGLMVSGQYFTNAEQPVGVVVDGVVQGLGSSLTNLGEVDRIEVLKGPQGTQFGKNSAAGVINITTIRPELGELFGNVYGSYGNMNQYEARAGINVPLGENAAMRVSVYGSGYDGFILDTVNGEKIGGDKQRGGAIKVLFKPTRDLDLFLSADTSKDRINGGRDSVRTLATHGAFASGPANTDVSVGSLQTAEDPQVLGETTTTRSGISLEANYRLGQYTLSSVTAYRTRNFRDWGGGTGGLPAIGPDAPPPFIGSVFTSDTRRKSQQTTQEFRVTSPRGELIEYVAGYLYYNQPSTNKEFGGYFIKNSNPVVWALQPEHGISQVESSVISNAVFGDGKLKLASTTDLLFGLRYTRDTVSSSYTNPVYDDSPLGAAYTTGGGVNPPLLGATPMLPYDKTTTKASKLTYKLGVEHHLNADTLLFATYSTGYLGPVINYKFSGKGDVLKPQTNTNLTLGIKSEFLDRRLTVNADVFIDRYKDFQTGYFDFQQFAFVGENAGSALNKGVELEVRLRPTNQTMVGANFAYLDSKFRDYCTAGAAANFPGVGSCTQNSGGTGYQLAGFALPNVPKVTANFYASQTVTLSAGYALTLGANYYYRTKTRSLVADPMTETPGYGLLGLNAGFEPESRQWRVAFYARNVLGANHPQIDASGNTDAYLNYTNRDNLRQYGVSVDWRF